MIALLSTSFPSSTLSFVDSSQTRGSIDILERDLHARVGGATVAAYGDHGSIHSIVYDDAPIMRWSARVDYPRELTWQFERRRSDQTAAGFISAAEAVAASERAQSALVRGQKLEALGRLTGGIAHEFNNLLQTLTTALQLASLTANQPKVLSLIDTCKRTVSRATAANRVRPVSSW